MKLAGILIDTRKLPTFVRNLDDAGYEYDIVELGDSGTTLLKVQYLDQLKLHELVKRSNRECIH